MPLSEFAKRQKTSHHHTHTGHGRRDQLTAGERTRILRMLRDEGGRIADEESQVHIGAAPPVPDGYDFDFDDEGVAPPPSAVRPDVPAKPAVVVGIDKARKKRQTGGPTLQRTNNAQPAPSAPPPRAAEPPRPPPSRSAPPPMPLSGRSKPASIPPPAPGREKQPSPRRPLPSPFSDGADAPPRAGAAARSAIFDEPTRLGGVDEHLLNQTRPKESADEYPPKFLPATTDLAPMTFDDDEATRMAGDDGRMPPKPAKRTLPPPRGKNDERTRAVDIRGDENINDVDWDID
jgi:hypothetical protein